MVTASEVAAKVKVGNSFFNAAVVDEVATNFFASLSASTYHQDISLDEAVKHLEVVLTATAAKQFCGDIEYFHATSESVFFISSIQRRTALLRRLQTFLTAQIGETPSAALCVRGYTTNDGRTTVVMAKHETFQSATKESTSVRLDDLCSPAYCAAPQEFRTMAQRLHEQRRECGNPVHDVQAQGDTVRLSTAFLAETTDILVSLVASMEEQPGGQVRGITLYSFKNGLRLYALTISGVPAEKVALLASLVPLLPTRSFNTITRLWDSSTLTCEESVFVSSMIIFASYFTPTPSTSDFTYLQKNMAHNPKAGTRLLRLRTQLSSEVTSEHYIANLCAMYPDFIKMIYEDFKKGSTSQRRKQILQKIIQKLTLNNRDAFDISLFSTFVKFNEVVKKHNFYKQDKAVLAFRIDPAFLLDLEYPRQPYGVFLFAAPNWRGFHVRFTDIARGGVRMILSKGSMYNKNKRSVFQENYNLAHTQLLKNKDIPEGGSKGTILVGSSYLNSFNEEKCRRLFLQYVDGLLDVIVPGEPGVVDNLKQEEIIFLGPDENTAGSFPAAGAIYSKGRNYSAWKSFTTGKDPELGGIPHDVYGMTTQSVRAYLEQLYHSLGVDQKKLTKFVTGGPRGDLGGNEILMGTEKIIGMVDSTACIHDPDGIDQRELSRLVKSHLSLKEFKKSKLSKNGFLVLADEENVKLPDGSEFETGTALRDEFHFLPYSDADVFVPCGGRPRSVTLENVGRFLKVKDADGESMLEGKFSNLSADQLKFKYISEGANLFISQDARLALEKCGVILFKDATANKGGVTSSSFEVLAGLALSDAEHAKYMSAKSATDAPEFYKKYVKDIEARIVDNARKEFEAIWHNSEINPQRAKTLIADALSSRNVQIRANILASDLFQDKKLVKYILHEFVPKTLLEVVSIDKVMERVPVNYQHAICAMWLASNYVYSTTLDSNEFDFFRFMSDMTDKAEKMVYK